MNIDNQLLQALHEMTTNANRAHRQIKAMQRAKRDAWIQGGRTFELTMQYKGRIGADAVRCIPLEGHRNALKIFNAYRANGHKLNLMFVALHLDGEKVQRVNFKY